MVWRATDSKQSKLTSVPPRGSLQAMMHAREGTAAPISYSIVDLGPVSCKAVILVFPTQPLHDDSDVTEASWKQNSLGVSTLNSVRNDRICHKYAILSTQAAPSLQPEPKAGILRPLGCLDIFDIDSYHSLR